jgi:hypothetical protein
MLGRYLAVTPEAIRDVSASVFRPDNRVVLTYVPAKPPVGADALDGEPAADAEEAAA